MLKKSASGVPRIAEAASRGRSHRSEAQRAEGEGKVPIRSHVIEASGSSEAWYVPPRLFARCGLAGRPFGASCSCLGIPTK
jgi:hypothetical protein